MVHNADGANCVPDATSVIAVGTWPAVIFSKMLVLMRAVQAGLTIHPVGHGASVRDSGTGEVALVRQLIDRPAFLKSRLLCQIRTRQSRRGPVIRRIETP